MDKIIGKWHVIDKKVVVSEEVSIIKNLIANKLLRVNSRDFGWTTLYQDPDDSSYWELTYPQGEMQGGGPPTLTRLSEADAISLYKKASKAP